MRRQTPGVAENLVVVLERAEQRPQQRDAGHQPPQHEEGVREGVDRAVLEAAFAGGSLLRLRGGRAGGGHGGHDSSILSRRVSRSAAIVMVRVRKNMTTPIADP